jgi:hypothetical protein
LKFVLVMTVPGNCWSSFSYSTCTVVDSSSLHSQAE